MLGSSTAGIGATPTGDFRQSRLGSEPDSITVELQSQVQAGILMATGLGRAWANADPKAGALHTAYRSLLTSGTASLARIVTPELRRNLEREVRLRFAADIDNRRPRVAAVRSLVAVASP